MVPLARGVHAGTPFPPVGTVAAPCGSPEGPHFLGTMRLYDCSPSIHAHLRSPLAAGTSPGGRRWRALLGSWGIPLEACPELETPAAPYVLTLPAVRVQPSARITASASATGSISELNLRGLLPCCVRFAPTGHPVNGNTGYRPAGSLWPGGTRTRWIPLRGFTCSFSLPLFPAFPNAICRSEE